MIQGHAKIAEQPADKGAKSNLLVVDDDSQLTSLFATILEKAGYGVCLASNGLEALEAYRRAQAEQTPFDLVMMDLHMPVMDGRECLLHLRELDRRVPVLLFTGSPYEELGELYSLVKAVIPKPVRIAPLLEHIGLALGPR